MNNDSSTLRRGIEVLTVLQRASSSNGLGNNRIADFLGVDKSQVSRTLKVLLEAGLVERDDDTRTYRLGPAAYTIGMRAADQPLMRMAAWAIREVVRVSQKRAFLVVREQSSVVTVWSDQPVDSTPVINSIGMVYSVAQFETGRALLYAASREEIHDVLRHDPGAPDSEEWRDEFVRRVALDRASGYSYGVFEDGSAGLVAVPVWGIGRSVVAAIGVSSPALRDEAELLPVVRVLLAAATGLTARLSAESRPGLPARAVPYRGWPRPPCPSKPL